MAIGARGPDGRPVVFYPLEGPWKDAGRRCARSVRSACACSVRSVQIILRTSGAGRGKKRADP